MFSVLRVEEKRTLIVLQEEACHYVKGIRRENHVEELKCFCGLLQAATVDRSTPAPSSERLVRWPLSPAAWQLVLALLTLASQTLYDRCCTDPNVLWWCNDTLFMQRSL